MLKLSSRDNKQKTVP